MIGGKMVNDGLEILKVRVSMQQIYQQTLAKAVEYAGIGLHSGKEVNIKLAPAAPDTGIVFIRTDLPQRPEIKAEPSNVTSTLKATTVSIGDAEVFTIEHLMAALSMLGIDNCRVEMDAPEPPVTDGSAGVFVCLILQAGRQEQKVLRKVYALEREFSVHQEDRYICALPYDGFRISFVSVNSHPLLGTQYFDVDLTEETFLKEIANARTVAFMHEVEQMKKMGLGLGGSVENVLVFDDTGILSVPRFENELVRHKILDVIGDFYLLGPIKAHIIAVKTGHAFNAEVARQIETYRNKGEN
ncbi:MAG TPA: UDP-3-O-[3-hydroxymyristoyl] N-acetylglucosamine deacetylase [Candidatus Avacidaminococcus intestinavium]|uniref:UDP-3-O-acyl-N-acetylglucosamine deacetylase n=1 Tax=Candidatus Avacidaminococcus intestinavium TaxID=2840684 RepID=A0A9D1MNQ1_9FIRM|nr:UDP-3-O-[3-hydroxymyristoyl] N-acetylglucosamine deacetylase [Candidatus Avacidaminococcus intestinavium]